MGPGIYAFTERGKEKRGAREPGGAGLHRRRECVQSAFRTGSTPSGGRGTGPIFPGPGAIGRSGTGIRPGPMTPGAGTTGGGEPRTGGGGGPPPRGVLVWGGAPLPRGRPPTGRRRGGPPAA